MTRRLAPCSMAVVAVVAIATPAHADEATARDFWGSAAMAATATVYAPSPKAVRQVGLEPLAAIGDAQLEMVCRGEWNVSVNYDGAGGASVSIYQATRACQPDFGAGDAPTNPSTFTYLGASLTTLYQGCQGTGEGQEDPAEADCPSSKAEYAVYGTLPGASGKRPTALHLDAVGLSRGQLMALVRSMRAVPAR